MNEQEMIAIVGDFAQRYFGQLLGKEEAELEAELTDDSGSIKEEYAMRLQELIPSLGEEFWEMYQEDPDQAVTSLIEQEQSASMYKKGGKLEYLKLLKKGGKMNKKKCACGCDLVISKGDGGKLTSTCACKCGGKLEKGGKLKKDEDDGSDTWYKSGTGENSMNPKDWKRTQADLVDPSSNYPARVKPAKTKLPEFAKPKKPKFPPTKK